ncbi:MAG: DUF885 domain-containing protein [Gammaproteobacteria bacterium]|nr:DUF885 domain-containing protein [Gammaproteobacteria bacterium]TVQ49325.1 MAG: DUF885 domain-containing protein [Gammaproteobacteria bacterium]
MRLPGLMLLTGLLLLPAGASAEADAVAETEQLLAEVWDRLVAASPVVLPGSDMARHDTRWPDLSLRALEAEHRADRQALRAIARLDREALPGALALDLALTERLLLHRVSGYRAGEHLLPIHALEGVQLLDGLTGRLAFTRVEDYEAWLGRLETLDSHVQQTIALMRQGMRRGVVMPQAAMRRVPAQVRALLVDDIDDSGFFAPFLELPATVHPVRAEALRSDARVLIETRILPAYRRLHDFLVEEYLPVAPADPGLGAQRDGEARYLRHLEWHTRPGLTPDILHRQGLAELARLQAPAERAAEPVSDRYDSRTDWPDPETLLTVFRATAKRMDATLPRVFALLPGLPYGIEPLPVALADHTGMVSYQAPSADGRHPGVIRLNVARPPTADHAAVLALIARHGVPGHHLATALPLENATLPVFRRHYPVTAFTEGWALYATSLLDALGLSDAATGQRVFQLEALGCAVDLVADTGLHALGWSRAETLALLRDHLPLPEGALTARVDAYIARPAQALACAVGAREFSELRDRAEARLGDRFDIREFHTALLSGGALPPDTLATRIETWIDQQLQIHGEPST